MRPRALALAAAVLALSACAGEANEAATTVTEPAATEPGFGVGTAEIRTKTRVVRVPVEIAETDAARQLGLMHRASLPPNAGMAFVFDEESSGGFWMKNTLIPLSIAFYDADGKIRRILDMEPCRADPCPVYEPGVTYRGALEVNKGAFRRWGVKEGDVVTLRY